MIRKGGYGLFFTVVYLILLATSALALPTSTTDITDPYDITDDPVGGVTLPALRVSTATNSPQNPTTEHDKTRADNGESLLATNASTGSKTSQGPHGRYTDNTAACGRCHALHTAKSQRLIRFETIVSGSTTNNTIYGTCTFCHSFNGQSTYDVKDGMIWDTYDGKRYATNGGGFERMLVVEGEPEVATVVKSSSSHRVNHSTGTKFRIPGAYDGTDVNMHLDLTCSSCHNPHGDVMSRQLRKQILVPNQVEGTMKLKDTYSSSNVKVQVQNVFGDEKTSYNNETVYFCATCHQDYTNPNGGAWSNKRRHKVNYDLDQASSSVVVFNGTKFNLPVAKVDTSSTRGILICLTCHYAHGTFVRVQDIKTGDSLNIGSGTTTLSAGINSTDTTINVDDDVFPPVPFYASFNDSDEIVKVTAKNTSTLTVVRGQYNTTATSHLLGAEINTYLDLQNLDGTRTEPTKNLRMDNRGVCQNCHNWPDVNRSGPKLTTVLDPNNVGSALYGENGTLKAGGVKALSKNNRTIIIRFNQYVLQRTDSGSSETLANYTINNVTDGGTVGKSSATVQPDGKTVVIRLSSDLLSDRTYTLNVSGVKDTNLVTMTAENGVAVTKDW